MLDSAAALPLAQRGERMLRVRVLIATHVSVEDERDAREPKWH
jgi:hypothetical protein